MAAAYLKDLKIITIWSERELNTKKLLLLFFTENFFFLAFPRANLSLFVGGAFFLLFVLSYNYYYSFKY
jgi:hypothetical protein